MKRVGVKTMEKTNETINVLWTGGYDSTFRVLQLSKFNIDIQPYYFKDNRISEENELNAIAEITQDIKNHSETKATILPLITYNTSDVKNDEVITKAYKKIRESLPLGSQYDWLARFAKEKDMNNLELGLEKSESSVARQTIEKFGEVQLVEEGQLSYYIINKDKSNEDLINIFGRFHFPNPLYNLTKQEMLAEYEKLGFKNIVKKTWFCFTPIDGEPCGLCNPCKSTLNEGMDFRFSKRGLRRNKFSFIAKVLRKLKFI